MRKFEPSVKQYQALMYLGIIPVSDVIDWKRVARIDKQWQPVFDDTTVTLWYWGAAWWWKSYIGCKWLSMVAKRYPGTRRFIAREELKRLKWSTLLTLFEIFESEWMVRDVDYSYNNIAGEVKVFNWDSPTTVIMLLWLEELPSDPLYSRFWSMEFTWWFIDEANEVAENWFNILGTRIRFKLEKFCPHCAWSISSDNFVRVDSIDNPDQTDVDDKYIEKNLYKCPTCNNSTYGLCPKVLCTFNPDKWRVYHKYYKPWRQSKLPTHTKFIPALATDNPHLPRVYIQSLKSLKDKVMKQRLLYGNFDYDDSPGRLYEYDELLAMFSRETNTSLLSKKLEEDTMFKKAVSIHWKREITGYNYRIVCDPARHWRDRAVITLWNGLSVEKIIIYLKSDITELEDEIRKLWDRYWIWSRQTIVDDDWVWWWLKDSLKCVWFVNNAQAIQPKKMKKNKMEKLNYQNLKTQCYFEIANHLENMAISVDDITIKWWTHEEMAALTPDIIKERLLEELDAMVEVDIDKDWPKKIIPKKDLKKKLWRSPDMWDCIMMRMFWEIKASSRAFVYW